MLSLFTNRNKQILNAIEKHYSNRHYKFTYKPEEIDNAKVWYISNTVDPNLTFIQQMMEVKSRLE